MAYYLIDFENVKSRGMEGVELLTEEDTVCIFYSDNADSMTFDLHRKLNETKANIIYHKVAVGTKNALDFQLATYLGYLICGQQNEGILPQLFYRDQGQRLHQPYGVLEGAGSSRADHPYSLMGEEFCGRAESPDRRGTGDRNSRYRCRGCDRAAAAHTARAGGRDQRAHAAED